MIQVRIIRDLLTRKPQNLSKYLIVARNASSSGKPNVDKYQELSKLEKRPLYLDAQATTPIDPRVLDAKLPYMTDMYGSPHSRTHAFGWESEKATEIAREVNLFN